MPAGSIAQEQVVMEMMLNDCTDFLCLPGKRTPNHRHIASTRPRPGKSASRRLHLKPMLGESERFASDVGPLEDVVPSSVAVECVELAPVTKGARALREQAGQGVAKQATASFEKEELDLESLAHCLWASLPLRFFLSPRQLRTKSERSSRRPRWSCNIDKSRMRTGRLPYMGLA